jgi:hypothetical protein
MLINIKTNLKSLKFGNDRPGGGSSGQPFIQTPIPDQVPPVSAVDNLYNLTVTGPTVPIQGQADTKRINRFLKSPAGQMFITRQQYLQLANPDIQSGKEIALGGVVGLGLLGATRIYNGYNTSAQVSVQGSGFHFDRHGSVPVNPYGTTYDFIATPTQGNPNPERLRTLYNLKIAGDTTGAVIQDASKLNISLDRTLLLQYVGGPNSIGGIGLTTIPRFNNTDLLSGTPNSGIGTPRGNNKTISGTSFLSYTDIYTTANLSKNNKGGYYYDTQQSGSNLVVEYTTTIVEGDTGKITFAPGYQTTDPSTLPEGPKVGSVNTTNKGNTWNYHQISTIPGKDKNLTHNIREDFRLELKDIASTKGYSGAPGTSGSLESRYGIGKPGGRLPKQRVNYLEPYPDGQDRINMLDILSAKEAENANTKDLITFRFDTVEIESDQKTNGAAGSTALIFRAFLTGLTDNHAAEYSSVKYVGRGDKFYTYDGFTRTLSFNFKIAAQSREEMQPLYRKLNYLISQMYPDYQDFIMKLGGTLGNGFMRSPLVKLTIGDYIAAQPGFITSMNITVPDDSPWEINYENSSDIYQLPHVLDVACQFTPIHDFLPRRSWIPENKLEGNKQGDYANITPLITPNKSGNTTTANGNLFGIGKNSQFQSSISPIK